MEKAKYKNFLIKSAIFFLILYLLIFIVVTFETIKIAEGNAEFVLIYVSALEVYTRIILIIAVITEFLATIYYVCLKVIRKTETVQTSNYVRDLPKGIPAAVASLLIDFYVDNERDYTATFASLISKGYISINENRDAKILKNDTKKLFMHERYVYETLCNKKKFDVDEFKNCVKLDAQALGLLTSKKKDYKFLIPIVLFLGVLIIFRDTIIILPLGMMLSIFMFVYAIISDKSIPATEKNSFVRTRYGEQVAKEAAGIKKFLHDYTILKEKGLADAILYDEYIVYAVALGEAERIEEFIINNEQYRNLLYKE